MEWIILRWKGWKGRHEAKAMDISKKSAKKL
jgi:hypothetical protein